MEEAEIQRRIVRLLRGGPIKFLEGGRYTMRCIFRGDYILVRVVEKETDMFPAAFMLQEIDDGLLNNLHYALHTLNTTSNRLYYRGTILQSTLTSDDIIFINANLALANRLLAFEEVQDLDAALTHHINIYYEQQTNNVQMMKFDEDNLDRYATKVQISGEIKLNKKQTGEDDDDIQHIF